MTPGSTPWQPVLKGRGEAGRVACMRALRTTAVVVAGTTVVLLVVSVLQSVGAVHKTPDGVGAWTEPFFSLAVLGPTFVGLSIAYRRPRNTVAWIMLLGPLLIAF